MDSDVITAGEFEDERHPIPDGQERRYQLLIDRSVAILNLRVAGLRERASSDMDVRTVMRGVVFDMVQRAAGSLDGNNLAPVQSQSAEGFSVTYAQPTTDLYVLDKELALLSGNPTGSASRARTIRSNPAGWSGLSRW